jgi:MscS family membrane protein
MTEHGPWLADQMPRALHRPGPWEVELWQWLALPLAAAIAWLGGVSAAKLSRMALGRVARRTAVTWDDAWLERTGPPVALVGSVAVSHLLLPLIGLHDSARGVAVAVLRSALFFSFFWLVSRSIDVAHEAAARAPWAMAHPASRALLPLGTRVLKVGVFAFAVVAMLAQVGYPVASLIAGLGIGGLAVALGAQKTLENLFGAFSIGVDQPFVEGDFVKIEDFVGTVEAVGLRSTRVRTLDRTLITIPNGKLAELRVESYAARDRIRLFCSLGVVYGTSAQQMRTILSELERVLRSHPKIWADNVVVRFKEFGQSSLDRSTLPRPPARTSSR